MAHGATPSNQRALAFFASVPPLFVISELAEHGAVFPTPLAFGCNARKGHTPPEETEE